MTCPNCSGSGHTGATDIYGNGGSDFMDCVKCGAADQRNALYEYIKSLPPLASYDLHWAIFQYAMRLCEEKIAAQSIVVGMQKRRKGDK